MLCTVWTRHNLSKSRLQPNSGPALCVCFGSARADSEQTLGSPKLITESRPMKANDGSGLTNRPVNHDNFLNALTNQRADQSDSYIVHVCKKKCRRKEN